MTYRLDLPNGAFYTVPDDVPRDVAERRARELHPELYLSKQETFGGALMKGGERLVSDIRTLAETPFVGKNEAARRALERSKALEEEYGTGADFGRVKEAYKEGVLPAAGELLKQSGLAMTEMAPYLAEMGIASKVGAKFGSPLTGLGVGAYVPRLSQNIEEQAAEQQATGRPIDVSLGRAAEYAVPRAALDVAASVLPLGKSLAGKLFGDEVAKMLEFGATEDAEVAARSILGSAARGVGVNLAEQVPIQVAQAALGRAQLGKPLLNDEAFKEYGHAGYVAGIMSPLGAIGGIGERGAARSRIAAEEQRAQEEARLRAEEKPGIDETTGQYTMAPELFTYDEDKWAANAPKVEAPTPPVQPVPYSGQLDMFGTPTGGLFGNELLPQRGYDLEAEAQQRAAGEALGVGKVETTPIEEAQQATADLFGEERASRAAETAGVGQDKYMSLLNNINMLDEKQWITPAFVSKTLGVDIAQAKSVMKDLESDGYIANPNKAGWYKPTEKVAQDAKAPPAAPKMGGFNIREEEQRPARMIGGRNLTLDEQRRAPMMGGRNLLLEEEQNVSGIKSDTERNAGEVGGKGPVAGRPTTSPKQPIQQRGIGESSTTEPRTDRLVSDRTPAGKPDEGAGRGASTLDTLKQMGMNLSGLPQEDRSRILRMPYVEARQKMLEANEPNVRWQMAADKLLREREARRAAVRNETERLGSMARREAPTKSERAVESLRNGNLGESLYHLMNEAGGHIEGGKHPYPHGEAAPLRYLARALFNTIHRGDIGEREKIVDAEIARRAQEVGETQNRTLTDKERRDIRNRIMNDHKLTKVDVLDVDGRLTAAGRIIYKAGKNGKPIVDKEGNLVRNFTPDSERLVPLTGKAKLNTYSGDFESLGGGKIFKSAFAGAEVAVEKPRMNSEDKAVIDRLKKEGKLAEYDPKQNKFYFTEAGLNDRTILHEMVHAATVKVLKQYADPTSRKSLSETQRIGAQELNKIYEIAKKQLGEEHANALENIYEFASHAATDKNLQQALSEIPAGMLGTVTRRAQPSLWNMFTRALARMFGLDHTQGKTTGNALLNASQAIHDILSTPEKGIDVPPLAERAPSGTGTARANESAEKINKAQEEGNDKELLKNIGKAPLEYYDGSSPDFLERTRRALSNMPSSLRDGVNSFFSMDHLYQIYKKEIPTIKEVHNVLNGRQSKMLDRKMHIRSNLVDFYNIVKDNKYSTTQMNNFHDIALQSTLNQIELLDRPEIKDKDGNITQRARKHVDGALYDRYKALPEPMKKMYKTLRDEYDRMSDEYVAKLVNGLNATEAQKLRASYEAARLAVYLPLYRRGQYWLSFKDKNGEIVQRAFRSVREREQIAERVRKSGGTEIKSYERLRDMRNTIPPTSGFLSDVIQAMKKQGITDQNVYDAVYEAYLDYLPAQSIRQRFREREGTLGMERDTIQSYANVATTMETMLNNLDYAPKLDKAMESLRTQASDHLEKPGVVAAVRNIEAQVEFARNPKISNAINKLGFFNYTWYLAGNASSAIVNLTHLPMVVYPLLWGKHGTGPTEAAFANAFKVFKYKGDNLVPKGYEKLYEEAKRTGALHEHMGQEIYDLRETSVNDYTGLNKRVFEKLNYMFNVTDRMNREATLMAAYDLALGKMKTTKERATEEQHAAATNEAIELVNQSYGTATLAAGPRILQNNVARIALTFKRFALNRMFILGRVFKEAFWGESQDVKNIARKQLLGIYATAFAFGGIAGLPLYSAANLLANMLMDDEDNPLDFDDLVRKSTNDLAYRGPINKLLNLAVSHRVGWNDMFWVDDPKRLADVGVFTFILERSLGPAYSQLLQLGDAAEHFANGRFERGFELVTPVAVRNVMKGIRYGLQGATTKTGEKISDVSFYNAFMQAFGFAPADLSETQAESSAGLEIENKIKLRRDALLDQWWGAYSTGNTDAMQEVQDDIDKFNEKNPDYPITESTKSSSVKLREKRALDAVNGINFNPKLKQYIMEEVGIEDNTQSFAKGGLVKSFAGGGAVEGYADGGDIWMGDEDSMFAAMTPSQRKYMQAKIAERMPDYAASVPDTLWNAVPYIGGTALYGALRPFTSAETAQQAKETMMSQYADPVHRMTGVENKPGPVGRAFTEAMDLASSGLQHVPGLSDPRDAQEAADAILLGAPKIAERVGIVRRDLASLRTPEGRESLKNAVAELATPSYVVKPKGGNWLNFGENPPTNIPETTLVDPASIGRSVSTIARISDFNPAVTDWAKNAIPKYIKNEMGTPEDSVRKLFDEGIMHVGPSVGNTRGRLGGLLAVADDYETPFTAKDQRVKRGYPSEGLATTPEGRVWESVTDNLIRSMEVSSLTPEVQNLANLGIVPGTDKFTRFKDLINQEFTTEDVDKINGHIKQRFGGDHTYDQSNAVTKNYRDNELLKLGIHNNQLDNYTGYAGLAIANNPYLFKEGVGPSNFIMADADVVADRLGFHNLAQDLNLAVSPDLANEAELPQNLRLDASKLGKLTLPDAIKLSNKIGKWRIDSADKELTDKAKNNAQSVYKSFDDGWKVVKFEHPDPKDLAPALNTPKVIRYRNMKIGVDRDVPFSRQGDYDLATALQAESCRMGNCIGHPDYMDQYFDTIKEGKADAFSLRTPDNKAEATIFIDKNFPSDTDLKYETSKGLEDYMLGWVGHKGVTADDISSAWRNADEIATSNYDDIPDYLSDPNFITDRDEIYRQNLLELADKKLPSQTEVRQIGGNAIKNPDRNRSQDIQDETLKPYIQDFLKDYMKEHPELEFKRPNDLENAGLVKTKDLSRGRPWLTDNQKYELEMAPKYVPKDSIKSLSFTEALNATPIKRWNAIKKAQLYTPIRNSLRTYEERSDMYLPNLNKTAEVATYNLLNKILTLNSDGAAITGATFSSINRREITDYIFKDLGTKIDKAYAEYLKDKGVTTKPKKIPTDANTLEKDEDFEAYNFMRKYTGAIYNAVWDVLYDLYTRKEE